MRAPDREVRAHRERAREIVLRRHVDDDRHAQPMRNRDRFFERHLAVPDDVVGDHEENGGGVLGDRILEMKALDPRRRPGRHHPCARQRDRLSNRRPIVHEMSRPDHDLGSEPGRVGQSLDAREIASGHDRSHGQRHAGRGACGDATRVGAGRLCDRHACPCLELIHPDKTRQDRGHRRYRVVSGPRGSERRHCTRRIDYTR